jgi:hypothetical protein
MEKRLRAFAASRADPALKLARAIAKERLSRLERRSFRSLDVPFI